MATGLEHDEARASDRFAEIAHANDRQTAPEIAGAGATLPTPKVYGPPEGNVLLVGWGSTQGPIREAVDRARAAGDSVSALHLRHLNPLPNGFGKYFLRLQPRPGRGNE